MKFKKSGSSTVINVSGKAAEERFIADPRYVVLPDEAPVPDGAPTLEWKADQLKAYATEHGVEFKSDATKPEILELIEAAAKTAEGDAGKADPKTAEGDDSLI